MTQQKLLQTRILKMGWLHRCICKSLEDCGSSRLLNAPGKLAALLQERGASAFKTKSSSSQEPSAPMRFAALFSLRSEEPENQFKSSVFKNADPSNLGFNLSIIESVSFSSKLVLKYWNYWTHSTDLLNLDENKFVYKKNYL